MPFLAGFGKRKELRYGTAFPGSNLTDFPKLFEITADADIAAELAGGGGIAVTASDGTTEVPFGLYSSSAPASGTLIIRAKFSPLTAASTGDVMGYLYYDAGASTPAHENKVGTVSNGYVLFMPLEEDPSGSAPQMYDWVTGSNVGTTSGGMVSGDSVSAQVGKGLSFGSGSKSISVPSVTPVGPMTVECVVTLTSATIYSLVSAYNANGDAWSFWYNTNDGTPNNALVFSTRSYNSHMAGVTLPVDGTRHHVAGTWDRSTVAAYIDGVLGTTKADTGGDLGYGGSTTLYIGDTGGWAEWSGVIDEYRISTAARSADWLAYTYQDEFHNSDTFTLSTQQTSGGVPNTATVFLLRA